MDRRRETWTCRWSRFGGLVGRQSPTSGFVYWLCEHPCRPSGAIRPGECDTCPLREEWLASHEPTKELPQTN